MRNKEHKNAIKHVIIFKIICGLNFQSALHTYIVWRHNELIFTLRNWCFRQMSITKLHVHAKIIHTFWQEFDICRKLPHLVKRPSEQEEEESEKEQKKNQYESVRLNYTRLFEQLCVYIFFILLLSSRSTAVTATTTRLAMCIWDLNVGNVWVLSGWKFFSHFFKIR